MNPFSENVSLDNVGEWVNVSAAPGRPDLSDRVATLGGQTSKDVISKADVNRWSKRHHRDFEGMMKEIGANDILSESRKNFAEACETGTRVCPKGE